MRRGNRGKWVERGVGKWVGGENREMGGRVGG